ncbi:MAG: hypothetical protein H7X95_11280, partial [Deltaproteobacteria bacterium]|nr:hypothetical protein [Deltaproteobacteria bacterium]
MVIDGSSDIRVPPARVSFTAGDRGEWRIDRVVAVRGQGLAAAAALTRSESGAFTNPTDATWILNGVRSNERYVERAEKRQLGAIQEGLGRPTSRAGALIPIQKNDAWW